MINALTPCTKIEEDSYDWFERHAQKCAEAAERNHELVLIGDSITHYWETFLAPENYKETFNGLNVMNLGFGWDRTCNVLWRLQNGEFAGQTPKLVVLNIGTNNFGQTERYPGDKPELIADGVLAIVKLIHEMSPATKIVVVSVFQRETHPSFFREKVRELNKRVAQLVAELNYVQILDISEKFMTADGTDLDTTLFIDRTHPSPKGYEIWSNALKPILKSELR